MLITSTKPWICLSDLVASPGGVIGWTAAIAAFGPFLFGVGLTLMSPTTFYIIGAVWAVMCIAITWWRYARKGAAKPS